MPKSCHGVLALLLTVPLVGCQKQSRINWPKPDESRSVQWRWGLWGEEGRVDTDEAIRRYTRGQVYRQQGKIDLAMRELQAAASADPTLSIVHETMGDIHRHAGDYQRAVQSYKTACEVNPYSYRPHYNLGVVYQHLADAAGSAAQTADYLRQAVEVYLRAITLDPKDYDSHLNISACYYRLGKFPLAEHHCRQAIALRPGSSDARANLGTILDTRGDLPAAIRAYKASLELDPNQAKVRMNLGSTYLRQGSAGAYRDAVRQFVEAARIDPNEPLAHELEGLAWFRLRRYDRSLEAYQQALEINPDSAEAYRGVGVAHMGAYLSDPRNGKLRDLAIEAWRRSLSINPDQPKLVELVRKYAPPVTGPDL
jgi:tetratricopeptide (TPR) repeat protein